KTRDQPSHRDVRCRTGTLACLPFVAREDRQECLSYTPSLGARTSPTPRDPSVRGINFYRQHSRGLRPRYAARRLVLTMTAFGMSMPDTLTASRVEPERNAAYRSVNACTKGSVVRMTVARATTGHKDLFSVLRS